MANRKDFYEACVAFFEKKVIRLLRKFFFSAKQREDLLSLAKMVFWERWKEIESKEEVAEIREIFESGQDSLDRIEKFIDSLWPYEQKRIRAVWEDFLIKEVAGITRYEYYIFRSIQRMHDEVMMEEQRKVTAEKLAERIRKEREKQKDILPAKYENPLVVHDVMKRLGNFHMSYLEEVISIFELPDENPVADFDLLMDIVQYREVASRILNRLSVSEQRVLYRRFVEGERHRSIADALKISEGISKNSLQTGIAILKRHLDVYPQENRLGICYAILDILEEDEKYLNQIESFVGYTQETLVKLQALRETIRKETIRKKFKN